MIIRKKFSVESAHIVRNCTSQRCSHSIHGHSAVIEVFLEADRLDNAQMIYDFGLMKGTVKQFIDSMDHCYLLCKNDEKDFVEFIKNSSARWIELPFNPSAEMLSMFIFHGVQTILDHTQMNNGEGVVKVKAVRYHETTSGYAECDVNDVDHILLPILDKNKIEYSGSVMADWDADLAKILIFGKNVENPKVEQQIEL